MDVVWWATHKFSVEECLVRVVKVMYNNAISSVGVNGTLCEEFVVKVCKGCWSVQKGSVLSTLLFIMVLEALCKN